MGGRAMRLTAAELAREAAASRFQIEPLERVILLLELLERSGVIRFSRIASLSKANGAQPVHI